MSENHLISVPHFPSYDGVRHLLGIWEGRSRKQITDLHQTIWGLVGTPQNVVDWTKPDVWIKERLKGENRDLAEAIWINSNKTVNPRYACYCWRLIQKYQLFSEADDGNLQLTGVGLEFFDNPEGKTVQCIDEQEGLIKILSLVKMNEPTRISSIREDWDRHLERNSNLRSPATVATALNSRIKNLLERKLIERDGVKYSLTGEGTIHLKQSSGGEGLSNEITLEFQEWLKTQKNKTRKDLLNRLLKMDPREFEHLVKLLLDKMGYENVEVTPSSGDGGVDVTAKIEFGITSVDEVVQVKRHQRAIQRKDLDALRGSLHRFKAIRGTIITTAKFSSGTKAAALESGAPPITLIDGDKLVDLLIEHDIGVRGYTIHLPDPLPKFREEESDETNGSEDA